ncbi:MAG TPA: ABC transporter permease [Nocardioidaceae bacterium]
MRAVRAIAAVELRRFLRDRSNIFFVFIFPLLLVLVLGAQFGGGGGDGRVALSGGQSDLRSALAAELTEDGVTVTYDDPDAVRTAVARGRLDAGVLLTEQAAASFDAGDDLELEVVAASQQGGMAAVERVRAAATRMTLRSGQVAALVAAGVPESQAGPALDAAADRVTVPELAVVDVDDVSQALSGLGQFDLGAAGQLLLFVFLISLAGSTTLIQSRRLGVMDRVLAAPVSAGQALAGQALGRWTIAMFQGTYIMVMTALLFRVNWGNLWVSLLVVAVFSAVAAGAAMLVGSLIDSENAAAGVGVGLGLVLAALGGSMMPRDLFPDTLRTVSLLTPHAWGYEAFAEIQRRDAGLIDVLPELGVLALMAAVLLLVGTVALRRSMARAQ